MFVGSGGDGGRAVQSCVWEVPGGGGGGGLAATAGAGVDTPGIAALGGQPYG